MFWYISCQNQGTIINKTEGMVTWVRYGFHQARSSDRTFWWSSLLMETVKLGSARVSAPGESLSLEHMLCFLFFFFFFTRTIYFSLLRPCLHYLFAHVRAYLKSHSPHRDNAKKGHYQPDGYPTISALPQHISHTVTKAITQLR